MKSKNILILTEFIFANRAYQRIAILVSNTQNLISSRENMFRENFFSLKFLPLRYLFRVVNYDALRLLTPSITVHIITGFLPFTDHRV